MATRFVATHECDADIRFKQAYIDAKEEDIKIIKSPVGMPGRALWNGFLEKVSQGKKIPFKCPYECLKTCKVGESPFCISLALMNAQRGRTKQGFVFCGANAHLVKKIVPRVIPINVENQTITKEFMHSHGIFEGFDVGLEMSGSPHAFSSMLTRMINGGRIAMLAIMPAGAGIDWDLVVFKGLTIKGIYGREIFETWYKGLMMVQTDLPLDQIITHRFHYTDFQKGFDAMLSGESGKVILNWEDEA